MQSGWFKVGKNWIRLHEEIFLCHNGSPDKMSCQLVGLGWNPSLTTSICSIFRTRLVYIHAACLIWKRLAQTREAGNPDQSFHQGRMIARFRDPLKLSGSWWKSLSTLSLGLNVMWFTKWEENQVNLMCTLEKTFMKRLYAVDFTVYGKNLFLSRPLNTSTRKDMTAFILIRFCLIVWKQHSRRGQHFWQGTCDIGCHRCQLNSYKSQWPRQLGKT